MREEEQTGGTQRYPDWCTRLVFLSCLYSILSRAGRFQRRVDCPTLQLSKLKARQGTIRRCQQAGLPLGTSTGPQSERQWGQKLGQSSGRRPGLVSLPHPSHAPSRGNMSPHLSFLLFTRGLGGIPSAWHATGISHYSTTTSIVIALKNKTKQAH